MNNLLVCDMDGTVIPLDDLPHRTREIAALKKALMAAPHVRLAYATGRDRDLARAGIEMHDLPRPDYLICDVGTSLYHSRKTGWSLDPDYRSAVLERFGGHSAEDVHRALAPLPFLTPQEPERQAEFKISFYIKNMSGAEELARRVREALSAADISRMRVVVSLDPANGRGLLDILPDGVAKDFAVRFLAQSLGVPTGQVVYAGDSGNDLDAFLSGFRCILVANTEEWVREKVRAFSGKDGARRFYLATKPFAAGVLEGARYFGLITGPPAAEG